MLENVLENSLNTLSGTVQRITYRNEGNSYTVAEIKTKKDTLTVVGFLPFLNEGDSVVLHGNYVFHTTYGQQFKCDLCEVSAPATQTQILSF